MKPGSRGGGDPPPPIVVRRSKTSLGLGVWSLQSCILARGRAQLWAPSDKGGCWQSLHQGIGLRCIGTAANVFSLVCHRVSTVSSRLYTRFRWQHWVAQCECVPDRGHQTRHLPPAHIVSEYHASWFSLGYHTFNTLLQTKKGTTGAQISHGHHCCSKLRESSAPKGRQLTYP
jgi:hypothetical protein